MATSEKRRPRKTISLNFTLGEWDAVERLMAQEGFKVFSEMAKSKILGDASSLEIRLAELIGQVQSSREANDRYHQRWVDTVKKVGESDAEVLAAATYKLQYMTAKPQDRAEMDRWVNMKFVNLLLESSHGYRKT